MQQKRREQKRKIVLTSKEKMQRKIALLLAIIMALSVLPVHIPLDVTAASVSAGANILHIQNVESDNIISRVADVLPGNVPHSEHMFTDNLIASSLLNTMHAELATLNIT